MQGKVKITVIATGFDRQGAVGAIQASASETPVDLQNYATRRHDTALEQAMGSRLAVSRRPVIGLPLPTAVAYQGTGSGEGDGSVWGVVASPLDLPAFLRRQNDA